LPASSTVSKFVREIKTASAYYIQNDSKATNVDATLKALDAFFFRPAILVILGGKDKGSDYTLLLQTSITAKRAVLALLIGRGR